MLERCRTDHRGSSPIAPGSECRVSQRFQSFWSEDAWRKNSNAVMKRGCDIKFVGR